MGCFGGISVPPLQATPEAAVAAAENWPKPKVQAHLLGRFIDQLEATNFFPDGNQLLKQYMGYKWKEVCVEWIVCHVFLSTFFWDVFFSFQFLLVPVLFGLVWFVLLSFVVFCCVSFCFVLFVWLVCLINLFVGSVLLCGFVFDFAFSLCFACCQKTLKRWHCEEVEWVTPKNIKKNSGNNHVTC